MGNILEGHGIHKQYGRYIALHDVSFQIQRGSIFGLLGPNGAGKTSLIRIITQITAPDKGQVLFDGKKLEQEHIRKIGYLPEERGLYKKMKVGEQLLYLAKLKGLAKNEAEQRVKDWFIRFDIKQWWDKNLEELSKGMAQKVQFISTVMHLPDLIILDEPFSGFDPINAALIRDEILRLNREYGATIIFSTHRMETVEELCSHVALINKSRKVLDGATADIKKAHRTNTFIIQTKSAIEALPEQFELLHTYQGGENHFISEIKIPASMELNHLLMALLPQNSILAAREKIPDFNEIFINTVKSDGTHE
jgi:ABC-2 type transport system ATP-binding protein